MIFFHLGELVSFVYRRIFPNKNNVTLTLSVSAAQNWKYDRTKLQCQMRELVQFCEYLTDWQLLSPVIKGHFIFISPEKGNRCWVSATPWVWIACIYVCVCVCNMLYLSLSSHPPGHREGNWGALPRVERRLPERLTHLPFIAPDKRLNHTLQFCTLTSPWIIRSWILQWLTLAGHGWSVVAGEAEGTARI